MELNREQIVKSVECCSKGDCDHCPNDDKNRCIGRTTTDALSLIKQLTNENEAISERYVIQVVTAIELDKQVQKLTEENERLRAENENKCKDCAGCLQWKCDCSNIEAYAVEKYKSAIIEYYSQPKYQPTKEHPIKHTQIEYLFVVLDQIAKEMVEGMK